MKNDIWKISFLIRNNASLVQYLSNHFRKFANYTGAVGSYERHVRSLNRYLSSARCRLR